MTLRQEIHIKKTGQIITDNYSVHEGMVYIFGENGRLISDYSVDEVEFITTEATDIQRIKNVFNSDWCDFLTREQSKELINLGLDDEEASYTMTYYENGTQCGEDDIYHDCDGNLVDADGCEVEVEIKERWRGDYDYEYQDDAPIFAIGDVMRVISHKYIKSDDCTDNVFNLSMNFEKHQWVCSYAIQGVQKTVSDPVIGNVLFETCADLIKAGRIVINKK